MRTADEEETLTSERRGGAFLSSWWYSQLHDRLSAGVDAPGCLLNGVFSSPKDSRECAAPCDKGVGARLRKYVLSGVVLAVLFWHGQLSRWL